MTADATELVHRRPGTDARVVLDRDVTAERGVWPKNRVAADMTIVRHVDVGHEHVAIADPRDSAAACRPAIDGDELPEDVPGPDQQTRGFALELEILGHQADRRERKNLGAVADIRPPVDDRRRPDCAAGADADVRTDHGMRTDRRALADFGRRVDDRGRVDFGAIDGQAKQQLALGHNLIVDACRRMRDGERPAPAPQRHLDPQPVAGDNLSPELRIVHTAQVHARAGGNRGVFQNQDRRRLDERFNHQHRRHQRRAGEMSLEEFLADGNVLDRDDAPAGVVLDDGVDQHRRIAVTEAIERLRDIDGHRAISLSRLAADLPVGRSVQPSLPDVGEACPPSPEVRRWSAGLRLASVT
jgi:hypothetical protein